MPAPEISGGGFLSGFEAAAMDAICKSGPCNLHEILAANSPDREFEDICQLIRDTVGCALFRRDARPPHRCPRRTHFVRSTM